MGSEGARDVLGKNGDSAGGEAGPGRFADSESLQLPLLAGCLAAAASVAGEKLPASCSGSRKRGETDRDAELVSCGRFQAHRAGPGPSPAAASLVLEVTELKGALATLLRDFAQQGSRLEGAEAWLTGP